MEGGRLLQIDDCKMQIANWRDDTAKRQMVFVILQFAFINLQFAIFLDHVL